MRTNAFVNLLTATVPAKAVVRWACRAQSLAGRAGLRGRRGALIIGLGLILVLALAIVLNANPQLGKGLAEARSGNYVRAYALWYPLARKGNAEAQYRVGWLFENGLGREQSPTDAITWYLLAAEQGHVSAQYNLGIMAADGRGMPRDYALAAVYFREAALRGHAKAQYNLGVMYQTGRGVPEDLTKARYWFDQVANGGNPPPRSRSDLQPSQDLIERGR